MVTQAVGPFHRHFDHPVFFRRDGAGHAIVPEGTLVTYTGSLRDVGVNDEPEHARALARLARDVPCKFNLIPFNPFPGTEFVTSARPRIIAFQKTLTDSGYVATIRKTRGEDIDAACGQLAGRVQDRTRRRVVRIRPTAPASTPH